MHCLPVHVGLLLTDHGSCKIRSYWGVHQLGASEWEALYEEEPDQETRSGASTATPALAEL